MIMLIKRDGNVIPYLEYEFVGNDMLVLRGSDDSYIVESDDIKQKLDKGLNLSVNEKALPMIYSVDKHGALTNESFLKYGVPVQIKEFNDRSYFDDYFLTNNITRKRELKCPKVKYLVKYLKIVKKNNGSVGALLDEDIDKCIKALEKQTAQKPRKIWCRF